MTADAEARALLQKILDAFRDAPYPGDDGLAKCRCGECLEVREKFSKARRREDWLDRPLEVFHGGWASPTMLTPEAYRYFWPLFAAAVLFHWREADVYSDFIVWDLDPFALKKESEDVPDSKLEHANKRLAVLTDEQRAAIAELFEFLETKYAGISYGDGEVGRAVINLKAGRVVRPAPGARAA